MADSKNNDVEMNGEDFSKDVTTSENENGTGTNGTNGNADGQSNARDDDRKLFVGGLSWETSEKELREHFGKYGEIESINVKTDPQTGRSRGFAFIVFTSTEAIDKVHAAGEHIINNKKVDPKKAKARHGKIFVGGLTNEISDDEIKTYFSQFGNIVDVELPFDKQKSQRKGFCFITFDSEQVVNELLKTPKQKISGKEVDVKRATPKPENQMMAMRGARGGIRGGRGGFGRGGYPQWPGQGGYAPYGGYAGGYDPGYGDYYSGGYYNGYDYGYDYGYGGGYDGGYGGGSGGGGRGAGGPRGGPKGAGGYPSGKQRGTGRQPRHQPY
ncbi:PREDICTED: RNA-binding protein squid isoform X1 [Bactrocera latifrons]|uniref:RNA-binding protein squid isoform X1 n=2 Tax=Bactrocera dorsalis TaxID=27457 RepID=A0A6I9W7D1_BACDO|nr:RNA-binding protein squid isoform X1 [Bactrocera dorsalis]XP_014086178.1 RNA-binding protein squid isoform X1 [Bactrocera oleae]XP_018794755.1 PREDICTED: RNA-binding protein squid isoform X1 [Bactrocera latifrons]XP_039948707.1 RNA-binding protein squid isoform X1 [Bactrocera tryoni]XP_050317763.1 RNA-binding protein squid isoform X1 [Bactrocera neohumeralis]